MFRLVIYYSPIGDTFMQRLLFLIVFITASVLAVAQVKISGDARIRPRYDVNDKSFSGGSRTEDFYYMYRARLRVTADIDNGWFFSSMLSHNGISDYSVFGKGDYPDVSGVPQSTTSPSSNEGARRATISFMELYFGKEIKEYGFRAGLIPLGSIANPMYDLHYYPAKMVDIPHAILNTDAAYGAAAYVQTDFGKFGAKVMVEDQRGIYEEDAAGVVKTDRQDIYTIEINYGINASGFIIAPMALFSIAKDSVVAPNTFGINIGFPKVSDFTFSSTFGYTTQGHDKLGSVKQGGIPNKEYTGWLLRLKAAGNVPGGSLQAWVDFANRKDKGVVTDDTYKYLFYWVSYEYLIYKSDKGSVAVSPTIRYATETKNSSKTMSRLKAEMNFDIKF